MRENEPVLLVLSVCDGEIILEKGEILCEKYQRLRLSRRLAPFSVNTKFNMKRRPAPCSGSSRLPREGQG